MIESGYVHDVRLVTLGSFLDGDHLTGSTQLKIMDAADFNEEGGSLILDVLTLDYVSADMETDTITLASPLAAGYEDGVPLYINPLTYEKQAVVVLDGYDEALTAVVPHSLYDRLVDGIREDFMRESVTIELENSTWLVKNVYGKEPVIDGSYLENVVADDVIDGIITTVKLADDAVTQAKVAVGAIGNNELIAGAVDAAKIAADAVTAAALADGAVGPVALTESLSQTVMQRFTDAFEDSDAWTVMSTDPGTSFSLVTESTAPSGGKVGQANGYAVIRGTTPILYDPNSTYRLSARIRCKTEAGTGVSSVYVGLFGLAGDKVTPVNRTGVNATTSHTYVAASGASLPASSGWTIYTGYAKGRASTGSAGTNTDIQSPGAMHDNVRYVVPYVWLNYANHDVASIMQVDSVTLEVLRTGVVTANELAANSVIAGKILAGTVGATELAANSVVAGKIAAGAVQAGNIAALAIQTGDLAANAITTAKLAALSVTANELAANAVTASKILAGTITADRLDVNALIGKTAQSSNFVNDPEQGITGWSFQADGSAYLRSAVIGNDLFEINETGNAKFQGLSVSDIYVDGEDFEAIVDSKPRGIINVYPLSGALTYAAISTDYLVTRFVIPSVEARMYRIILDNWRFDRGTGTNSPTQFGVDVFCKYGSQASNADSNIHTYLRGAGYSSSAADDIWTSSHDFSPPDANLGQDCYIAIYTSINGGLSNGPRLETTSNTRVVVEDIGSKVVYAPTVDITNYVAPAKTTYTTTYNSTWMASWGSGNGLRTDNNAYQGNYSSTWANNYTKYGFSSAIQTALTGATVKKVELYLDNNHFYSNSGGNAIIGTHANSTEPTGSTSLTGTFARQSIAFTKGQAKWVTLSSVFGTDLKSGAALGITLGRTSGGSLAEYGYFSSSAKLRITYEK